MSFKLAMVAGCSSGLYIDEDNPDHILADLGELLRDKSIDDTQEARAAIYGVLAPLCLSQGLELVIVQEEGVQSIAEVAGNDPAPMG